MRPSMIPLDHFGIVVEVDLRVFFLRVIDGGEDITDRFEPCLFLVIAVDDDPRVV